METIHIGAELRIELYKEEFTKPISSVLLEAMDKTIRDIFMPKLLENVGLDDHTLAELARLGHPYAVRYDPSRSGPEQIHGGEDRLVHIQSGGLKSGFQINKAKDFGDRLEASIVSNWDEIDYLIFGTSKMRPRRFHEKTVEDTQETIFVPIITALRGLGINYQIRGEGSTPYAGIPTEAMG